VEEKLHKFLDNASVLPQVASNIVSPHINEEFLEAVVTLSQRLKYLEQTTPPKDGSSVDIAPVDTRYGRTILPELERLKVKAVGKIRDYFTNQINGIRKPKSNIQILQQNSLVKYAKLFHGKNDFERFQKLLRAADKDRCGDGDQGRLNRH